jgi:hypothetical protein
MLPKVVGILQSAETGTCHLGAFDQQCSNGPWGHEGRILPEWKFQGGSKRNTKLSRSQHQIDKHARVLQKGLLNEPS